MDSEARELLEHWLDDPVMRGCVGEEHIQDFPGFEVLLEHVKTGQPVELQIWFYDIGFGDIADDLSSIGLVVSRSESTLVIAPSKLVGEPSNFIFQGRTINHGMHLRVVMKDGAWEPLDRHTQGL